MSKNRVDGPTPRSVPARSRPLTGIFEALPAPAPKAAKTRP